MPLQFQTMPIAFGGGLDTKSDKKQTVPGKLTTLENGIFTKGQRISKRNGYTATSATVVGGAALASPQALVSFSPSEGIEELVQVANNELYSYSVNQDRWIDKDPLTSVSLNYKSIYQDDVDNLNGDSAINGTLEVIVWGNFVSPTTTACAVVIDSTTGAQIVLNTSLSAILGRPRVIAIGSLFYIVYVNTANDVVYRSIDISAPQTISGETNIVTNANSAGGAFDIVVADSFIWLAYYSTTPDVRFVKLNSAMVSQATATLATTLDDNVFVLSVSTNVFFYWHEPAAGLSYAVYSSALGVTLGATVIDAEITELFTNSTAVALSATSQYIFYGRGPNPTDSLQASIVKTYRATVSTTAVTLAAAILLRSVRPASKAFTVGSVQYLWVAHFSSLQSVCFLMRYDGIVFGKSFYGKARGAGAFTLPTVTPRSSTKFFYVQAVITRFDGILGVGSGIRSGIQTISMDFADANAFESGQLGQNIHFGGGFLSQYDGRSVVECGFHLFPEDSITSPQTSGGNIVDGTYSYKFTYEWVDNMGQTNRSAPSPAVSAVVSGGAGAGSVNIQIPTLRVTEKKGVAGNAIIQIYRTAASGTIYYNVKSPASAVLYNDTASDSVAFTDTIVDSSLITNETLYTTGGVLENIAPESCTLLDVYQSRMVLAGMEDPLQFAYSKTQVRGEGVSFSDSFLGSVDPLGGPITTCRLMDDKIILFKNDFIFFVSGEGPNDTGGQNNYSIPQLITADTGCPFPKSTVLMPLGIMYKSNKGIYILTRGLQTQYIGADVQDYNDQDITSAILIQDKNQVRFLTSSGSTLVYDYFFQQWSTFTNHTGVAAVNWQSTYSYLRSNNTVYLEADGTFTDNGTEIVLKAATAWIKLAGIQGFQRIRRISFLGDYKSAHTMTIRVGYDYFDAYNESHTFDATTNIATTATPYQFQVSNTRQKCEAIRIEFYDDPAGGTGESYNVTDLSIEAGLKGGLNRMGESRAV